SNINKNKNKNQNQKKRKEKEKEKEKENEKKNKNNTNKNKNTKRLLKSFINDKSDQDAARFMEGIDLIRYVADHAPEAMNQEKKIMNRREFIKIISLLLVNQNSFNDGDDEVMVSSIMQAPKVLERILKITTGDMLANQPNAS
ncbi:MAG: hypothetical protein ACPGEF_02840, partial [Endozoicomonas sp.]